MLNFFSGAFAIAGLVAATGPIIIHLLNRRRYRVVYWAAMDFLREALERNRRILRFRDIFLLVLRTLCVLVFGLAMARPHLSRSSGAAVPGQPVHAVLVMDNSLSMGHERLRGTVLDEAKTRAREFIDLLPRGSWISVLPLCGSASGFSRDAYRTREDALEALEVMEVMDREGTAAGAAELALTACAQVEEVPSKRVVFIGDQQRNCWPAGSLQKELERLPEMQVVQVGGGEADNAWVADFRVQDGVVDAESPATLVATVRHEGRSPRIAVPVTLNVEGAAVASQTIDLQPGQSRDVSFTYVFDTPVEPGRASFVPASVSIPPDELPTDDRRFLMVPVVASLPVVFVDQCGQDEDARKGRLGETYHLRRLLAPSTGRAGAGRQLLEVRQSRMEELERGVLHDARVVAVAGVEAPDPGAVSLLREYVVQGGQLIIAAGAGFDPRAWTAGAWRGGDGILPLPLDAEPVGQLPEEASGELKPFFLDASSMAGDYFLLEGVSREEIEDLYRLPLFFKAVRAVEPQGVGSLTGQEMPAAREESKGQADASPPPAWLLWKAPESLRSGASAAGAKGKEPHRILAAFANQVPFLIEKDLGLGRTIFISSGLSSSWNTLPRTDAVLVLDRIFRSCLERTLPRRTLETVEQVLVPVDPSERRASFILSRPEGAQETLGVDALAADAYGVSIRGIARRGLYTVTALQEEPAKGGGGAKLWEASFAINGPPGESELRFLDAAGLKERTGTARCRWISTGEAISLEGAEVRGEQMWKWLMALVLACLFLEMAVLAWGAISATTGESVDGGASS